MSFYILTKDCCHIYLFWSSYFLLRLMIVFNIILSYFVSISKIFTIHTCEDGDEDLWLLISQCLFGVAVLIGKIFIVRCLEMTATKDSKFLQQPTLPRQQVVSEASLEQHFLPQLSFCSCRRIWIWASHHHPEISTTIFVTLTICQGL